MRELARNLAVSSGTVVHTSKFERAAAQNPLTLRGYGWVDVLRRGGRRSFDEGLYNAILDADVALSVEGLGLSNLLTNAGPWQEIVNRIPAADINSFLARKQAQMSETGQSPRELYEFFVRAKGSVNGVQIADRDVFFQVSLPKEGKPVKRVALFSPGYMEDGRNWYAMAQFLNDNGYAVVLMDHQWQGLSQGGTAPGKMDGDFGVARDVAVGGVVATDVAKQLELTADDVVLIGESMGGAGVLNAVALNDDNRVPRIQLDGDKMPQGLRWIVLSPYEAVTPSLLNRAEVLGAHVKGANQIALPAGGLPIVTNQADDRERFNRDAVMGGGTVRLAPLLTAETQQVQELMREGLRPTGRGYFMVNQHDPLACGQENEEIATLLGAGKPGAKVGLNVNRDPSLKEHIMGYNLAEYASRLLTGLDFVFQ
jgi:pimeloyl-ACP methyl ester carboxylesterase